MKKIPNNPLKKNLIFDFDGVILNSHLVKTYAFYEIFKAYGTEYGVKAKKFHLNNTGKSRYYKFEYIIRNILKLKPSREIISQYDKKFDEIVQKNIQKMTPSKHLIYFLKKKQKLFNMYISTGTPQEKIIKILKEKKILKYFNKVYGSPEIKIHHIAEIKKNKNKCIFIGDSFEDYNAAKISNIPFICKINSENISLRNKIIAINTFNSFKFLDKKIESLS